MMRRVVDQWTEPADHLALDEAMLLEAEEGSVEDGDANEMIRFWEFRTPVVVAGRSTRVREEIDVDFCRSQQIPILRRCTGGASIIAGPGCLMYSVVLHTAEHEALKRIDVAHQHVMQRVLSAVQQQHGEVRLQGICDLTWRDRKCSGNALRIARRHLLYHGTILYDFDLSLAASCLRTAPRQPEYRRGRDHRSFLTNLPLEPDRFAVDLCRNFSAKFSTKSEIAAESLAARIRELRRQRYDAPSWHFRH